MVACSSLCVAQGEAAGAASQLAAAFDRVVLAHSNRVATGCGMTAVAAVREEST
jgi:hypothetical protein